MNEEDIELAAELRTLVAAIVGSLGIAPKFVDTAEVEVRKGEEVSK